MLDAWLLNDVQSRGQLIVHLVDFNLLEMSTTFIVNAHVRLWRILAVLLTECDCEVMKED